MTRGPTPPEGTPPADGDAEHPGAPAGRSSDASHPNAPPGPPLGSVSAARDGVDGAPRQATAARTDAERARGPQVGDAPVGSGLARAPTAGATRPAMAGRRAAPAEEHVHADALQSRREALSHLDARLARPAAPLPEDLFDPLGRTDPGVAVDADASPDGNAAQAAVRDEGLDDGRAAARDGAAGDLGQVGRGGGRPGGAGASMPLPGADAPDADWAAPGPAATARGDGQAPRGDQPPLGDGAEGDAPPAEAKGLSAASDPALNRYIASLNLAELDLSDVELPTAAAAAPSPVTFVACAAAALGFAVALVWLPTTALYQLHAAGEALFWACAAGAGGAGWLGSRHWPAGLQLARSLAATSGPDWALPSARAPRWLRRLAANPEVQATLLAWRRPLLAAGIVALAACVAFVLPREPEWAGNTYSTAWFVAVVAAMSCGVLVGRFILAQAAASPLGRELTPFALPPWFRWVSFTCLLAAGLVTTFGAQWFNFGGGSNEFSLAGLGLATGVGGAIWLARRFDELEAKWRQEAEAKAANLDPDGQR